MPRWYKYFASISLTLGAVWSFAGSFPTTTVQNPFTKTRDYVLDGAAVFSAISAKSGTFPNLSSYARLNEPANFRGITVPDYSSIVVGGGGGFSGTTISNAGIDAGFFYGTKFGLDENNFIYGSDLANMAGHLFNLGNPHFTTAAQTGAEPALGNPSTDGWLLSSLNNGTRSWTKPLEACVDVFDGAPGKPIYCYLSGGVRSVVYDADGLNPSSMSEFTAHLFYGADEVTPLYWSWATGGASNTIYGTGTSSSFTPSVKSVFNPHSSNNYLTAMLTYSTPLTGRLYCKAGTPIAVSKAGVKGDKGEPGSAANVTESAVFNALTSHSNNAMYLKETSLNTFKIKFIDANGYERFGITGSGKLLHMDAGGVTRFIYDPATQSFIISGSSGNPIMGVYSAHRTRFYDRYGKPTMTIYSGQVVYGGT